MGKREDYKQWILASIRVAGYHDDTKEGTRLYIEHRVSIADYRDHFYRGQRQREAGMKCSCYICNPSVI